MSERLIVVVECRIAVVGCTANVAECVADVVGLNRQLES